MPLSLAFDLLTLFLRERERTKRTTLAAQTPSPAAQTAGSTTAPTGAITVQGCIQPSVNAVSAIPDAIAVGAPGSISTATPYILASVMKPTGTSGSSANASAPIVPTYQLSAEDSKLTPHVGHNVEITGTVVSPDQSASSRAASAPGLAPAPTLKVENVKMIADRCTP